MALRPQSRAFSYLKHSMYLCRYIAGLAPLPHPILLAACIKLRQMLRLPAQSRVADGQCIRSHYCDRQDSGQQSNQATSLLIQSKLKAPHHPYHIHVCQRCCGIFALSLRLCRSSVVHNPASRQSEVNHAYQTVHLALDAMGFARCGNTNRPHSAA